MPSQRLLIGILSLLLLVSGLALAFFAESGPGIGGYCQGEAGEARTHVGATSENTDSADGRHSPQGSGQSFGTGDTSGRRAMRDGSKSGAGITGQTGADSHRRSVTDPDPPASGSADARRGAGGLVESLAVLRNASLYPIVGAFSADGSEWQTGNAEGTGSRPEHTGVRAVSGFDFVSRQVFRGRHALDAPGYSRNYGLSLVLSLRPIHGPGPADLYDRDITVMELESGMAWSVKARSSPVSVVLPIPPGSSVVAFAEYRGLVFAAWNVPEFGKHVAAHLNASMAVDIPVNLSPPGFVDAMVAGADGGPLPNAAICGASGSERILGVSDETGLVRLPLCLLLGPEDIGTRWRKSLLAWKPGYAPECVGLNWDGSVVQGGESRMETKVFLKARAVRVEIMRPKDLDGQIGGSLFQHRRDPDGVPVRLTREDEVRTIERINSTTLPASSIASRRPFRRYRPTGPQMQDELEQVLLTAGSPGQRARHLTSVLDKQAFEDLDRWYLGFFMEGEDGTGILRGWVPGPGTYVIQLTRVMFPPLETPPDPLEKYVWVFTVPESPDGNSEAVVVSSCAFELTLGYPNPGAGRRPVPHVYHGD